MRKKNFFFFYKFSQNIRLILMTLVEIFISSVVNKSIENYLCIIMQNYANQLLHTMHDIDAHSIEMRVNKFNLPGPLAGLRCWVTVRLLSSLGGVDGAEGGCSVFTIYGLCKYCAGNDWCTSITYANEYPIVV